MRRYISMICVALIVVTCMVSPVRAVDHSSFYYEALDYTTVSNGSNRINLTASDNGVTISAPYYGMWLYYDIVFKCSNFSSVSVSNSRSIRIIDLGASNYRIVGKLTGVFGDSISLTFDLSSNAYVYFYSVRLSDFDFSGQNIPLLGTGSYSGGSFDMSKNTGDTRPTRTIITNDSFEDRDFILYLNCPDWRNYDYLEYQLYLTVDSLDSVSCVFGSSTVPIDVSYIYPDSSDSSYYLTLGIDCTSLDKSLSDDFYPMVIITGKEIFDGVSLISLMDSFGFVLKDKISSDSILFSKLHSWINSIGDTIKSFNSYFNDKMNTLIANLSNYFTRLYSDMYTYYSDTYNTIISFRSDMISQFGLLNSWILNQTNVLENAIRGDTSPGDSFQDEVDEKDQQLNDMAAVMDSVERPNLNSVNVSADSYVDGTVLAASMSGITGVIGAPVFLDVIMMSLIMATAGYVLFGKR